MESSHLPNHIEEFGIYLQYVRKLGFEESPDYDFLRELFNKVLRRMGESDDGVYDWMLLNGGKGTETRESRRQAREEQSKLTLQPTSYARRSNHTPNSVKRHASHPNNNNNSNNITPPLPTMPTPIISNTPNDAYKKMPDTNNHGNLDQPSYEQHKEEHRGGFWHALMSLMTCGTH